MMKNALLIILGLLMSFAAFPQTGKVYDQLTHTSEILSTERNYAIYLPPDYETSERSYPVLYLLHGAGDDQTGWIQFGEVLRIADEAIREGKATAMIIVMPDAYTQRLGFYNDIRGDWNYEDYFFEELMPFVENKYRIKGEKRYRAIAGLSMGGGGAFIYALHHPELFSSSCPLSGFFGVKTYAEAKEYLNEMAGDVVLSEEVMEDYYKTYNAYSLLDAMTKRDLESVRWYIDCGDDDFLYEGNSMVHMALRSKQVWHEYRVRDGAHNWTYWRESLPEVLKFVSDAFHQY